MKLHELEIGDGGPGPVRERDALPERTGGFVVRCHSAAAPPVANSVARAETARRSVDPRAASTGRPQAHDLLALGHADARMRTPALGQYSRDLSFPWPRRPNGRRGRRNGHPPGPARPRTRRRGRRCRRYAPAPPRSERGPRSADTGPRPANRVSSACSAGVPRPRGRGDPALSQIAGGGDSGPLEINWTSASEAAHGAAYSPATPVPTMTRSVEDSLTVRFLTDSLKLVAQSTRVSNPEAKTSARPSATHVTLAVILQVREGALQVLLWERAKGPTAAPGPSPAGTSSPARRSRNRSAAIWR